MNRPLPERLVRLRNARTGRVLTSQLTDERGAFSFPELDPGSYVVELIGERSEVLAASALLYVNAGELKLGVVRLPVRGGLPAWLSNATSTAAAIAASAASTGVLGVASTNDVSPDGTR
jgi:hypothetical protein